MPAALPRITLLLPGFRAAFARSEQRLPNLELLVSRGSGLQATAEDSPRASLERWQSDLLQALSLQPAEFPSAPLSFLGAMDGKSAVDKAGTWLHARPVHLATSIDGLALELTEPWGAEELSQLEPSLSPHCEQAGFKWHRVGNEVFLHSADALQIQTVAPQAAAQGLRGAQPQGTDARRVVQLSTELQMLLHEHPSQQQRMARNQLPVNAIWLWGAGQLSAQFSRVLPTAWSSEAYVGGIYRAHGATCYPLPTSLEVARQASGDAVVVAPVVEILDAERRWLAPLLQALRDKIWRSARVYMDEYYFDVNSSQLWHVWKRPHELAALRT